MSIALNAGGRVASARHTLLLVALFLAMAAAGALFQQRAAALPAPRPDRASVLGTYVTMLLLEWGLVLYVWRGTRRDGPSLAALIGGRWTGARDVLRDLALAVGAWGAWRLIEAGWERLPQVGHAASIQGFLPQGALESTLWVALSISAGFSEELVYRGYLQRQFAAWTGRPPLALVLQAVLFGVTHGYQGVESCLRITVYGLLFGLLASWRRSLRPGMLAHALTDVVAGLLRI